MGRSGFVCYMVSNKIEPKEEKNKFKIAWDDDPFTGEELSINALPELTNKTRILKLRVTQLTPQPGN